MTTAELIAALTELPPDTEVFLSGEHTTDLLPIDMTVFEAGQDFYGRTFEKATVVF